MEDLKDKAIVDMGKYNKLVEFYDKVRQGFVYMLRLTYGGNERITYMSESEAIKELAEANIKLTASIDKLMQDLNNANQRIRHLEDKNIQHFRSRELHLKELKEELQRYKNKARDYEKNYIRTRKYFASCSIWEFWLWRKNHKYLLNQVHQIDY